MAEEQLFHFKEHIPDDEAPFVDQQILDQVLVGAPSVNPEQQDAAPPGSQSSEPAQQSSPAGLPSTEPVDSRTPLAGTSSTGQLRECETCHNLFLVRETQSAPTSVNHSSTHTQGQASTSSAPLPNVNVPTTGPTHTNETPLPVLATEPDDPQARYAAARRRVDLANIAVDAALTRSIATHVTLRFAQANANYANASNHNQAHDALEDAQRAISRADDAWLECQLELLQAHVARIHAESDARHAGSAHASTSLAALQQGIPSQGLHSAVQQQPSQDDGDQGKERWKGKGRAENHESSSADQRKETSEGKGKAEKSESPSAGGKRTLSPLKIVKHAFRRMSSNEQHSPQTPGRSQSEPTFQSPIPSQNASSSQPANQNDVGIVIANGSGTDKDGSRSGDAGGSESKKKDGAEDGNPDATQVSEDTRKAEESGNPQSPGSSTSPGNTTSPGNSQTSASSQTPGSVQSPGNSQNPVNSQGTQTPQGGIGKKPGPLRRMSSELLSKLKTKK
ncbi:hypothetical protein KCU61_g881, partial [Aureobasidium melanogenum]